MSDLSDRDRVTAILTLAKAEPDLRPIVRAAISDPSRVTPRTNAPGLAAETLSEWQARAVLRRIGARTTETVWLARRLLEALDTIERVNALFAGGPDTACRTVWDGEIECVSVPIEDLRQALNGGNE